MSSQPTDRKIVFITGANTGLGYEAVKAFCQSPNSYVILLGSRSLDNAAKAIERVRDEVPDTTSEIESVQVDVSSDESIQKAYETVSGKYDHLDVLINNSGVSLDLQIGEGKMTTREAWNECWNVNVTGTHIMTQTFVPLLLKAKEPRLIFITSGTSALSETDSSRYKLPINTVPPAGWPKPAGAPSVPAYRSSKTGMNMMMREWFRILKNDGVKVFALSPGMLATGLGGVGPEVLKKHGAGDPSLGGKFMYDVAEGKRDKDAGLAIRRDDVIQPW